MTVHVKWFAYSHISINIKKTLVLNVYLNIFLVLLFQGDAFRGSYPGGDQNGFGFSTADRDNDGCSPCIFDDMAQLDCTFSAGGGWWFSSCGSAALNGDWHQRGQHLGWASGLHWDTWKSGGSYSLKASRMMIKPSTAAEY